MIDVPEPAYFVCERLQQSGFQAVLVGGAIRDALLDRNPNDWDVASNADPERVMRLFPRAIPTGIQHGTVTVVVDEEPIEVTTFRTEGGYDDARHPGWVKFKGVTLEEDLSRRDFTINAMAYDPVNETLIDPFGGARDLQLGIIRAVGDPMARFNEDALRMFRAVRFAAVLGFQIDPATLAAIPPLVHNLQLVAVERVQTELLKLLKSPNPAFGLVPAYETGILQVCFPPFPAPSWPAAIAAASAVPASNLTRLGVLLTFAPPEAAQLILDHYLRLSGEQRQRVELVLAFHNYWAGRPVTPVEVRRLLRDVAPELVIDLFPLWGEDVAVAIEQIVEERPVRSPKDLDITGRDLMQELGIRPGPRVGVILRCLMDAVTEDPSLNEREILLDLAARC
jgi:tRNA nucleotidyltransferase (CCA-adding enzyme)